MRRRPGCGWRPATRSGSQRQRPPQPGQEADEGRRAEDQAQLAEDQSEEDHRGGGPGGPERRDGRATGGQDHPDRQPPPAVPWRRPPAGQPGHDVLPGGGPRGGQRGEHPGQYGDTGDHHQRRRPAAVTAEAGAEDVLLHEWPAGEGRRDAEDQAGGGAEEAQHHPVGEDHPAELGGVAAGHRDQGEVPAPPAYADREGRPDEQHHLQQTQTADEHAGAEVVHVRAALAGPEPQRRLLLRTGPGRHDQALLVEPPYEVGVHRPGHVGQPGRVRTGLDRGHGRGVQGEHRAQVVGELDHPDHATRAVAGGDGAADPDVEAAQGGAARGDLVGTGRCPPLAQPCGATGEGSVRSSARPMIVSSRPCARTETGIQSRIPVTRPPGPSSAVSSSVVSVEPGPDGSGSRDDQLSPDSSWTTG